MENKEIEGPYQLPEGWKWVNLRRVTKINSESRNPTKEMPNDNFIYIDITGVEGGTRKIKEVRKIVGKKAPSRARRVIHTYDVLMSTVRPYLRAFTIVPPKYDNQICSTGFAVLTCCDNLLPQYLLHILFSDIVINQCNKMMVGAHYPALSTEQVSEIKIPLPPLEEQKRIIAGIEELFSRIEEIKKLKKGAFKQAKALLSSALHQVFSKADEKGWRWVRLGEVVETMNGLVIKQDPKNRKGYPISRIETIQDYEVDPTRVRYVEISDEMIKKYKYQKGDTLFSHINSFELVGKVAVYEGNPANLIHGMNLLRIRVKTKEDCYPYFLYWYFRTRQFRRMIEPLIKRAINQASINQKNLKSLQISLPPLEEQKYIVAYLDKIQEKAIALQKIQLETEKEIEKLREAILHKAFRGEL